MTMQDEVAALVRRHAPDSGRTAVAVGVGSDRAAVGDDREIYEIGSVTKVFTATLLAVLVEAGGVRLDTTVQELVPSGVEVPVVGRPITLLDLATHTAGLPRLPPGWILRVARGDRANPYAGFSPADLWEALARRRGRRRPGRVRYSNFGVGLLGELLGQVAGATYVDAVLDLVCRPLGLTDTTPDVGSADLSRFVDGHDRKGRPTAHWDFPVLAGAGTLRSTTADLSAFLVAQCRARTDAADPVARAMAATHPVRVSRWLGGQCLGWLIVPLKGTTADRALWHNGGTGGFRSYCAVVPEDDVYVVVLHASARPVDELGGRLLTAAARRLTDPPPPSP